MSNKAWKQRERQAAKTFGAKRAILSGSSGREGVSTSDSTHPDLYIETKLRRNHAARNLLDEVAAKARKENKIPLLMLASGGRRGLAVVCFAEDLEAIAKLAMGEEGDDQ